MGRKKVRPWQPKKPKQGAHVAPGLQYAITMASYQAEREKQIRERLAVDNVVHEIQKDYTEGVANWFYGLMALALHDEGWGAKRILRVQERIRDYHAEYNSPDFGDFDLWQVVRDEVKLDFDPGECGMKRWQSLKEERDDKG